MNILLKKKAGGKTTALVYASSVCGSVIVCQSKQRITTVKAMAQQLGVDIPEPIIYSDIFEGGYSNMRLLIDDLDDILTSMFGNNHIDCVTFTETRYNR